MPQTLKPPQLFPFINDIPASDLKRDWTSSTVKDLTTIRRLESDLGYLWAHNILLERRIKALTLRVEILESQGTKIPEMNTDTHKETEKEVVGNDEGEKGSDERSRLAELLTSRNVMRFLQGLKDGESAGKEHVADFVIESSSGDDDVEFMGSRETKRKKAGKGTNREKVGRKGDKRKGKMTRM